MYLNQFSERLKGGSRKSNIPNFCSLNLQCTTQPWYFLTSSCFFYCKLYHDILSYFSLFSPPPEFLPPPVPANLPLYSPMQFTVVILISVKQRTSRTELILVLSMRLIISQQVWMAEQKLLAEQQKEKELELQYNKEQARFKNRYWLTILKLFP